MYVKESNVVVSTKNYQKKSTYRKSEMTMHVANNANAPSDGSNAIKTLKSAIFGRKSLGRSSVMLSISDEGREAAKGKDSFQNMMDNMAQVLEELKKNEAVEEPRPLTKEELRALMIQEIIRALTGKEYEFGKRALTEHQTPMRSNGLRRIENVGSRVESYKKISFRNIEVETYDASAEFKAEGNVKTSDGKTINIHMQFNQSEHYENISAFDFSSEQYIVKRPIDPLVIDIDQPSFGISDITIKFDLDADGTKETMHSPGSGMGFIALDKNSNGKIDDGSELFGTKTGNGFADLAEYDDDGNGWIDEADSVYKELKVWAFNGAEQKLISLKEANVGAIYLTSGNTPIDIYNIDGHSATMQETGFFFKETGGVGTVHHIDFMVE